MDNNGNHFHLAYLSKPFVFNYQYIGLRISKTYVELCWGIYGTQIYGTLKNDQTVIQ